MWGLLLAVAIVLLIVWTKDANQLQHSYPVIFAGSNILDACNGVGTSLTAFSSSPTVTDGVVLYSNINAATPLQDGWYNFEGARLSISGGRGEVVAIVGGA